MSGGVTDTIITLDYASIMTGQLNALKLKNGLGRFLRYLIQLYSHGESAAIKVKVRIGQLWCSAAASN